MNKRVIPFAPLSCTWSSTWAGTGLRHLLVAFMTTLLLLTAIVAAPSVRTERKREQEEEMIWRGKQYIHAIKLYYRKNGRFPTNVDDLTKPKNGSLRYLRQAYKDPMNKEDGTWRLIYVGPSGQLIGSLKPPQTMQMGAAGTVGTPAGQAGFGSMQGGGNSQSAFNNGSNSAECLRLPGKQQLRRFECIRFFAERWSERQQRPAQPEWTLQARRRIQTRRPMVQPIRISPLRVDTSSFVGGNIIGIGSKSEPQVGDRLRKGDELPPV